MERRSSVGGGHIKKLKVGAGLAIPPYPYTQESVGEGGGQGTRADGSGRNTQLHTQTKGERSEHVGAARSAHHTRADASELGLDEVHPTRGACA